MSLNGSCHSYSTVLCGAHVRPIVVCLYTNSLNTFFSTFERGATRRVSKQNSVHGHSDGPAAHSYQLIQVGVDLRRSLMGPPALSRVSCWVRLGYLGLCPVGFRKPPRLETAQLAWATTFCVRDGTAALKTCPHSFLWLGWKVLLCSLP